MDRSDRTRFEFTGAKAAETLNGLLTNDVASLKPLQGCYAAALTVKGKVIADVRVFALPDRFVVDACSTAGPGLLAMLKKFVNPRLAAYRDISTELATIGVFGPRAAEAVAQMIGTDTTAGALDALEPHASIARSRASFVARVPDLGVTGYDVFLPFGDIGAVRDSLQSAGVAALDAGAAETLRIEAGRPLWGTDMDEDVLAQEAGLDRLGAISFDKGCYTGQETVARVHFRGHVNRTLRGLRSSAPLSAGGAIHGTDGAAVGDVRSAVTSPRLGPIALGYVRREIADGSPVTVRHEGIDTTAQVAALPFA